MPSAIEREYISASLMFGNVPGTQVGIGKTIPTET